MTTQSGRMTECLCNKAKKKMHLIWDQKLNGRKMKIPWCKMGSRVYLAVDLSYDFD